MKLNFVWATRDGKLRILSSKTHFSPAVIKFMEETGGYYDIREFTEYEQKIANEAIEAYRRYKEAE